MNLPQTNIATENGTGKRYGVISNRVVARRMPKCEKKNFWTVKFSTQVLITLWKVQEKPE
jgi:hypothetical protein